MHCMCVVRIPCVSKSCRTRALFWPRVQGPPTCTFVLWSRTVILPAPLYHQPSLLTGKTILPTWLLAQLSPRSIAPPPPMWPMECTLLFSVHSMSSALLQGERQVVAQLSLSAANNLPLAHPGSVGAANNLVASRQCQQRIANVAVAGVGGDEVDADSMRRP